MKENKLRGRIFGSKGHEIRTLEDLNFMIDHKSFESVEQFKYLGTTLTNRNSIQN
jgi:hypothetical protein